VVGYHFVQRACRRSHLVSFRVWEETDFIDSVHTGKPEVPCHSGSHMTMVTPSIQGRYGILFYCTTDVSRAYRQNTLFRRITQQSSKPVAERNAHGFYGVKYLPVRNYDSTNLTFQHQVFVHERSSSNHSTVSPIRFLITRISSLDTNGRKWKMMSLCF
jgi:hypothetical protein